MKQFRTMLNWLVSIEIWVVCLAVAASIVSTRLLPVSVGIAIFFWIIRWIARGQPSRRTTADWPVGILVIMSGVTLWATALPAITLPQVYRLLTGIALFYAIVNYGFTPDRLRLFIYGLIFTGLGLCLFSFFSVQWFVDKLPFIPSSFYNNFVVLVSDTVHPNVMAGTLVILIPIPLALLIVAGRSIPWYERLFLLFAVLGMGAVLVLTQSRGAWIALATILILIPVSGGRRTWIIVIPIFLIGGYLIYHFGLTTIIEKLISSSSVSSIDGRVEVWSRAIYMIQDFPFTGIGMGTFGKVADVLYPFFLAEPGGIFHAHNLMLQIAVDLGIPGLIAWLAVYLLVLQAAWQVFRYGKALKQGWITGVGLGLLGSQVALIIHGLTDAVTWGMVRPAPLVWVLWGVAMAASFSLRRWVEACG